MSKEQSINETPALRLKAVMDYVGITSANAFAHAADLSQPEVSRVLTGKRDISAAMAYRIVKTYKVFNIEWLVDGEGSMISDMKKYHFNDIENFNLLMEPNENLDLGRRVSALEKQVKNIIEFLNNFKT